MQSDFYKPHMGLPVDFFVRGKFVCQRWNTLGLNFRLCWTRWISKLSS